ncbi:hypothetical protein [Haloferula sp. BvORR071]|uniref:hypothetical protein n=1 Tax=Haloferula sp. BvORR071 TaxID=1396141 RepID=UPI000551CE39|nr:hypothetical protein [Haloferula sp. BvORR071]
MARYFTRKKVFQLTIVFLALVAALGVLSLMPHQHRGSDRATCVMHQRDLQMLMRHVQEEEHLKAGAPIEWAKLIGPGLLMESKPVCPVHGEYSISPVVTGPRILVAPCRDASHRAKDISDW